MMAALPILVSCAFAGVVGFVLGRMIALSAAILLAIGQVTIAVIWAGVRVDWVRDTEVFLANALDAVAIICGAVAIGLGLFLGAASKPGLDD